MEVCELTGKYEEEHSEGSPIYSLSLTILDEIFKHRLILKEDNLSDNDISENKILENNLSENKPWEAQYKPHLYKVIDFVKNNQPINMILPAFPGKSPNRNKTLGPLPDLAEIVALKKLNGLCESIRDIYPQGMKILICSDGYCFSDIVHIDDNDIKEYSNILKNHILEDYSNNIDFCDLSDMFDHAEYIDILREELMVGFAESLSTLRSRCKYDKAAKAMFRGITRFLFEDYLGLSQYGGCSRTFIQKLAKKNSLRVIQRSNAWSRLLEDKFSHSIRLSIHPQYAVSKKIGVKLVESKDIWLTPWHSVAVKEGEEIKLTKRSSIDEDRYALVFKDSRPSHFERLM